MTLRRSTRISKPTPKDPFLIGLDTYNLGIQNKTQLIATYRQIYRDLRVNMKALTRNQLKIYDENDLIHLFLGHPFLSDYFYCKGTPSHANTDAFYLNSGTDYANKLLGDDEKDLEDNKSEEEDSDDEDFIERDDAIDSEADYEPSTDDEDDEYTTDGDSNDEDDYMEDD